MSKKSSIKAIILLFSFLSISNFALSQNVKVYGTITNALNNDPIPFANIVVEGTMIGTLTFHGVTETVSFPVTLMEEGFSADFLLDTTPFNLKHVGVNKEVRLQITMQK